MTRASFANLQQAGFAGHEQPGIAGQVEVSREADLSAPQKAPQAHSWFSQADAFERRPLDPSAPSPQGAPPPLGDRGEEVTLRRWGRAIVQQLSPATSGCANARNSRRSKDGERSFT